ncbi:MAG: DUF1178 family protein [Pseudomonadota bacterium]
MIKYNLRCENGHDFESWFSSGSDYDRLEAGNLLTCAVCGVGGVAKAVMAPQVSVPSDKGAALRATGQAEQMLRDLRRHVESTADNVGKNFAQEARDIHLGDAPERPIYGQARGEEARALIEDGIPVVPLPWQDKKPN